LREYFVFLIPETYCTRKSGIPEGIHADLIQGLVHMKMMRKKKKAEERAAAAAASSKGV